MAGKNNILATSDPDATCVSNTLVVAKWLYQGVGFPGLFNALVLAGESGMLQGGVDVAAGLTRGIPETANI